MVNNFKIELVTMKIKNSTISGKLVMEDNDEQEIMIKNLLLIHRNNIDNELYRFPVKVVKKSKGIQIFFEIDVNDVKWESYYWDAFIEVEMNKEIHRLRVKVSSLKM